MRITEPARTGLSFDDVLFVPRRTSLTSRRQADTSSELVPGVRLRVPIISANTQWCTGDRMAVAMALQGGLGILHRMQTVEQQIKQLDAVKSVELSAEQSEKATLAADGRLLVGGAVGVTGDWRERAATAGGSHGYRCHHQ